MDYAAIDLHKKESQIRLVTTAGEIVDRRIHTSRDRLTAVFGGRPQTRILVEASTESEWVAQHLESLGHEVIVADPNYAPMYVTRTRRIKTDRRDAEALADACRLGIYRRAHRKSPSRRIVDWELGMREQLIRTRTRLLAFVRTILRSQGFHLTTGRAETVLTRVDALELPPATVELLAPLRPLFKQIDHDLARLDEQCGQRAKQDAAIRRLMTFPAIGPVTACAFVAALDDVGRFASAKAVACYLGLVPREHSSGEHQRRGRVLRTASPRVRVLLVQAAWRLWRLQYADTAALREWAEAIGRRRGAAIAIVALARRVARILFAMWRDETPYTPGRLRRARSVTTH